MKETLKGLLPVWAVCALGFYGLPLIIRDTGSAMFVLLTALPLLSLGGGLFHGLRHGVHLACPLGTAALFAPTVYLFYNESAAFYTGVYGVLSLAGELLGGLLRYLGQRRKGKGERHEP